MAAQTGQHHGAATMPAVTASPSILQGDESMFARIELDDIPKARRLPGPQRADAQAAG
jgi:hypothetical protein